MKAYRRNGDITPLVVNLGPIPRRVFNCRSKPLYTLEEKSWKY